MTAFATFDTRPEDIAVEFVNVSKRFGSVIANRDVSFAVAKGTVHGIVGENGAGKSTLMSALFGLYSLDAGEIKLSGRPAAIKSPGHAISHGIGMVHQHFMLVNRLSALQNIIIGRENGFWLYREVDRARARIEEIQKRYGLDFPLDALVRDLPVGVQQRIEITKALYRDADLLVMDEPTSVLTPGEVNLLFQVFRDLAAEGKTVILITHKLREILDVTENVTVMRAGRAIATVPTRDQTRGKLAELMVGRRVGLPEVKRLSPPGDVQIEVRDLGYTNARQVEQLKGVSFEIRSGEILGVAGVSGNGQTELLELLAGVLQPASGTIRVGSFLWDADTPVSVTDLKRRGVSHIPEDRIHNGLVARWSAKENAILGLQRMDILDAPKWLLTGRHMYQWCKQLMQDNDVRPAEPNRRMSVYSGGNQQKLLIGRELATNPDILIVGQPTRGVDIGAIEKIHAQLIAQRDAGKAIFLVSVELDEVMALSDRIIVLFEGRVMGTLERSAFDERLIGLMMAGSSLNEARTQLGGHDDQ